MKKFLSLTLALAMLILSVAGLSSCGKREIRDYYFRYLVTPDTLELRNLAVCAELIVRSARKRRESRGLHFTLDYPKTSKRIRQTVLNGFKG